MPKDKMPGIKRPDVYHALRRQGYNKTSAAKISNAVASGTVDRKEIARVRELVTDDDIDNPEFEDEYEVDDAGELVVIEDEEIKRKVKEVEDINMALVAHIKELTTLVLELRTWQEKAHNALVELIGDTPNSVLGYTGPAVTDKAFNMGAFAQWAKANKERSGETTMTDGLQDFMSFATNKKPVNTPRT